MAKAYDPSARANGFHVEYMVNATGDRWFIPYSSSKSSADQVTNCSTLVGTVTGGGAGGEAVVPS